MQGLDGLIRVLDRIDGLARIRYTTSHPNDMTQGLIDAHGDVETLMPFLHLPVQAGSDRILKAMNRSHTTDSYLRVIERVRAVRPDIALSGDFIVGFPGETEADFRDDARAGRRDRPRAGVQLQIQPPPRHAGGDDGRPGRAGDMDERLQRLQALLNDQQHAFNRSTLGRRTRVLIERTASCPARSSASRPGCSRSTSRPTRRSARCSTSTSSRPGRTASAAMALVAA